jgi:predicted enzyme related to lactoylglutathione lyase
LGHFAFSVTDIEETTEKIINWGGTWVGELTSVEILHVGTIVFAYMRDPEGNIIEIQKYI